MYLESLYLKDFRNYRESRVAFSQDTNLIYGKNGRGKTNLIEAVYLLSTSKSFRHVSDGKITRWGCDGYLVRGTLETKDGKYSLGLQYKGNKKSFSVNGTPEQKLSNIIGYVYCVLFSFEDISLITGPPVIRRSFLDLILSTTDSLYFGQLKLYVQLIRQKNSYLKGNARVEPDLVEVWNEQLVKNGSYIIQRRIALIQYINERIREAVPVIIHFAEPPEIRYSTNCANNSAGQGVVDDIESSFLNALSSNMKTEINGRQSIIGPHRDDFIFCDSHHEVRYFGSTGEARLASIMLKMAQAAYYTDVKNIQPILLVDDILPELDTVNRESVLSLFGKENQIIVTAIERKQLPEIFSCDRVFHIFEDGTIR